MWLMSSILFSSACTPTSASTFLERHGVFSSTKRRIRAPCLYTDTNYTKTYEFDSERKLYWTSIPASPVYYRVGPFRRPAMTHTKPCVCCTSCLCRLPLCHHLHPAAGAHAGGHAGSRAPSLQPLARPPLPPVRSGRARKGGQEMAPSSALAAAAVAYSTHSLVRSIPAPPVLHSFQSRSSRGGSGAERVGWVNLAFSYDCAALIL
jgi:hypothetical protein